MKKELIMTLGPMLLPYYLCSQESRFNVVFIIADDL